MESTRRTIDAPTMPAVDVFGDIRRVVVATNQSDEELARVRRVVLDLARTHDFAVVLYDRSNERWTDHPHPKGPVVADDLVDSDREHLVHQLRDFESAGVEASAWLATVPSLTAMLDVLQDMNVDAVMLPEHLGEPRVMDRLQIGATPGEMVQRIAELNLEHPPVVLTVPDDGPIRIAHYKETEA